MNAHADCLYASSRSCSVGLLWLPIVTLSTGSFAALTVTGLSAFLIRTTQLRSEMCGRLQSLHFIKMVRMPIGPVPGGMWLIGAYRPTTFA